MVIFSFFFFLIKIKFLLFFCLLKKYRKSAEIKPYCNPLHGELVENTKTYEVMILKEFGKITQ